VVDCALDRRDQTDCESPPSDRTRPDTCGPRFVERPSSPAGPAGGTAHPETIRVPARS